MKRISKNRLMWIAVCILTLVLSACGKQSLDKLGESGYHYYYPSTQQDGTQVAEREKEDILYMIVANDTVHELIHVYCYDNGMQYQYHYGLFTDFLDKYGNTDSAAQFTPGRVVWLGSTDEEGKLKELGISDRVWEYKDITRFETNPKEGQLKIADSLYSYGSDAITFSNDSQVEFDSITKDDTLAVVGIGKKILSVSVTTGHGTLQLANTTLFDDSYLQVGEKIFVRITPDMSLDLPEGQYRLAVANDGWGGTKDIKIKRGKTTKVDLDKMKGKGPKYGKVLFSINPEGAILYLDGQPVDYSQPISLKYGKHSLSVVTEEYDDWERTLYVNSPEATIIIKVTDEETPAPSTQVVEAPKPPKTTESADSQGSSETSTEQNPDLYKYLSDYLSTLSSRD